jgi:benzoate transport
VTPEADSLRASIDAAPMNRFQVGAVAICTTLNMLDGFDVLVVAFTASALTAEWQLTGAELGLLLSAGLFGMAGGSLFVAPWADRFGRRAVILFCLGLITGGMLMSAAAQGMWQLFALRVITGLGIGGMLASTGVITSEYSSRRWRSTNISVQATGYPIGATLGGAIAAVLIARYGWQAAFLFGGTASLLMFPLVIRRLPESLDFLLARRPPGALDRLNDLLRRMGRVPLAQLPERSAGEAAMRRNPLSGLFAGSAARSTLLIWSSFFLIMFSFYFVMSWTPKLLESAGLSAQQGIAGGVLLNLGGILGGSLFAYLASRFRLKRLTAAFLAMTAACTIVFGFMVTQAAATMLLAVAVVALAIGTFLIGSMAGLYSLAPILYPADVRVTGMGWAIGIGRIGAIIAPAIAGVLVDAGWTNTLLYGAFAIPLIGSALTTLALSTRNAYFSSPKG